MSMAKPSLSSLAAAAVAAAVVAAECAHVAEHAVAWAHVANVAAPPTSAAAAAVLEAAALASAKSYSYVNCRRMVLEDFH